MMSKGPPDAKAEPRSRVPGQAASEPQQVITGQWGNAHPFRVVFERAGIGMAIVDLEGRLLDSNAALREMVGYSEEELADMKFADFTHPEDVQADWQLAQELFAGGRDFYQMEKRYVRKDGRVVWGRLTSSLVRAPGGEPHFAVGMLEDITKYKKTEEALRLEKGFTDTALDAQLDTFFLFEPETGKVLRWNKAFRDITGYTDEEIARMPAPVSYYGPEDLKRAEAFTRKVLEEGSGTIELELICKDGRKVLTEYSVSTLSHDEEMSRYVISIGRDITERKRVEEALRLSLEKFEKTFQAAPVWVVLTALEDGRYIEVNETFLRALGYKREEVVGKTSLELETWVDPGDRERIAAQVREKGGVRNFGVQRKTRSGEIIHTLLSAEALELAYEQVMVSITEDITEQRRAEEEKARLEAQVRQAQRLESIGRLAGGVAHDLNNLLSPILGYGEMLLWEGGENDSRKAPLEAIVKAANRAKDMVRQLLAFSRKQALEIMTIDLNALLRNFEKFLRSTIREDIEIHMVLAEPLPLVKGDLGQLEQVIMNLAVNAQDAMHDSGTMTIETARVELDEKYAANHKGVTPGLYVMMAVSDTGAGMDKNTLDQIFEPFFTTKTKDKGTGLGLATVYGTVKQHNGNIWAYSEPGVGSTFKVYLPVSRESAPGDAREPGAQEQSDLKGSEIVLLVEDEEQVRDLALAILEKQGYRVLAAAGGPEALDILHSQKGAVDLLLTDVVMPRMNGRQLFEKVSGLCPDVKVLYMSGYTDEMIADQGILEDGVNFLQKPFTVRGLSSKVREVLDRS